MRVDQRRKSLQLDLRAIGLATELQVKYYIPIAVSPPPTSPLPQIHVSSVSFQKRAVLLGNPDCKASRQIWKAKQDWVWRALG